MPKTCFLLGWRADTVGSLWELLTYLQRAYEQLRPIESRRKNGWLTVGRELGWAGAQKAWDPQRRLAVCQ